MNWPGQTHQTQGRGLNALANDCGVEMRKRKKGTRPNIA